MKQASDARQRQRKTTEGHCSDAEAGWTHKERTCLGLEKGIRPWSELKTDQGLVNEVQAKKFTKCVQSDLLRVIFNHCMTEKTENSISTVTA